MNCLTTAGTVIFFILIITSFAVGFFVGKKNGIKIVTTVMEQKHNITDTWVDIKHQYNKLKTKV